MEYHTYLRLFSITLSVSERSSKSQITPSIPNYVISTFLESRSIKFDQNHERIIKIFYIKNNQESNDNYLIS